MENFVQMKSSEKLHTQLRIGPAKGKWLGNPSSSWCR